MWQVLLARPGAVDVTVRAVLSDEGVSDGRIYSAGAESGV